MHNCWTLVSSHCSPVPSYAVFMKKSSKFATDLVPKMDVEVSYIGSIVTTSFMHIFGAALRILAYGQKCHFS
jgi:purine-cytosine permease-like protein